MCLLVLPAAENVVILGTTFSIVFARCHFVYTKRYDDAWNGQKLKSICSHNRRLAEENAKKDRVASLETKIK